MKIPGEGGVGRAHRPYTIRLQGTASTFFVAPALQWRG